MEVYAAQIDRMDQGIGRILRALEETGQIENTLIVFLSDNGGCAEELRRRHGRRASRSARPRRATGGMFSLAIPESGWRGDVPELRRTLGQCLNTPFRLYKHWVHEGGIATPFIVHWPAGSRPGGNGGTSRPSSPM